MGFKSTHGYFGNPKAKKMILCNPIDIFLVFLLYFLTKSFIPGPVGIRDKGSLEIGFNVWKPGSGNNEEVSCRIRI